MILTTIRPSKNALAVFLVVDVLSFVAAAIHPGEESFPMHPVVCPLTFKFSTITPSVHPDAMDVIAHEFSLVAGAIGPRECAFAILVSKDI
eukprot:Skav226393  [mRNA]  locus=scaffold1631:144313:147419:- [translate_table: standard]